VKNAFKVFEGTSPDGFIKIEDLERALTVYGADRLTAEQVSDLIAQIETNQRGMFNYND
jgi:Ca2+-binding EF-hand superfamily protein